MIQGIHHVHEKAKSGLLVQLKPFGQRKVQVRDARPFQHVESGVAEPAHISGVFAHTVGIWAARDLKGCSIKPALNLSLIRGKVPITNAIRTPTESCCIGGIET